jgi:hypothetical protein
LEAGAGAAAEEEGPLNGSPHCHLGEALRKIGPSMEGPALQRFREEIAKIRIMQQRIDEIRRSKEPAGNSPPLPVDPGGHAYRRRSDDPDNEESECRR